MDPVITLPYSEWVVADRLLKMLPPREGYSICAPLSRQEKGFDLVIAQRWTDRTTAVTVQVKFSRIYLQPESRGCKFATWFNTFEPAPQADLFAIASLYPSNEGRQRGAKTSWWQPLILLFTYPEMSSFTASVRTRTGKRDKMFGFGFSSPEQVFQLRGDQDRQRLDFTRYVLGNRIEIIKERLRAA